MRKTPHLVTLLSGAVAGICFVLACGDDSSTHADAGSCPPAEPPIAGRIVTKSLTSDIAANARGLANTACPTGAKLLTGSCTTATLNPLRDVTLEQSGFFEDSYEGWGCFFKNNENAPVTIKVSIRCLMPAQ